MPWRSHMQNRAPREGMRIQWGEAALCGPGSVGWLRRSESSIIVINVFSLSSPFPWTRRKWFYFQGPNASWGVLLNFFGQFQRDESFDAFESGKRFPPPRKRVVSFICFALFMILPSAIFDIGSFLTQSKHFWPKTLVAEKLCAYLNYSIRILNFRGKCDDSIICT